MTIEELRERCTVWQERLRLQDWDVDLRVVRQWEVPNSFGTCSTHREKRHALIKVLDTVDDGDPADTEEYEPERTLIHELLHLHFDPFAAKDGTPAEIAQHQAIYALSCALLALDRKAP